MEALIKKSNSFARAILCSLHQVTCCLDDTCGDFFALGSFNWRKSNNGLASRAKSGIYLR